MTATLASMPTKSRVTMTTWPHSKGASPADTGTPVTASLADARSKRFRVLVLKQAGHADAGTCQDRALYERAHRIPARRSPPVWPMHVPSASVSWSSSRPAMPMLAPARTARCTNAHTGPPSKALEATYTVAGWRQGDGQLWMPNLLVRVRDARSKPRIRSPAGVKVMDNCGCRTCSCVCATR